MYANLGLYRWHAKGVGDNLRGSAAISKMDRVIIRDADFDKNKKEKDFLSTRQKTLRGLEWGWNIIETLSPFLLKLPIVSSPTTLSKFLVYIIYVLHPVSITRYSCHYPPPPHHHHHNGPRSSEPHAGTRPFRCSQ